MNPTSGRRSALPRALILAALLLNAGLLLRVAVRSPPAPAPRVALVLPEGMAPAGDAMVLVVLTAPVLGPDRATWPPATGLLGLSPRVPGETRWLAPDRLAFRPAGPLPSGREFKVLVSREIGSWRGTPLAGPCEFSFRTPPAEERAPVPAALAPGPGSADRASERLPAVRFSLDSPILPGKSPGAIALEVANADRVEVAATPLRLADLALALLARDARAARGTVAGDGGAGGEEDGARRGRVYHLAPGEESPHRQEIALDELTAGEPRGLHQLQAVARGPAGTAAAAAVVAASEIGLLVKRWPGGLVVGTLSLRDGSPLPGTAVEVLDAANHRLAGGRTGDGGLLWLEAPPAAASGPPAIVTAARGADVSFLEIDRWAGEAPPAAGEHHGRRPAALVLTARSGYRPGETLRAWALLGPGLSTRDSTPLHFTLLRPDGSPCRSAAAAIDEGGIAHGALDLPRAAARGDLRLLLRREGAPARVLGGASVAIEDAVLPRVRVELREGPGGAPGPSRREARLIVRGTLEGGLPAAGRAVEAAWRIEARPFAPAGWQGFWFGDPLPATAARPPRIPLVLDARGEAVLTMDLAEELPRTPAELIAEARVLDAPRPSRARLSLRIAPEPVCLGLRAEPAATVEEGRRARFECVAVDPAGGLASLEAIEVAASRLTWTRAPGVAGQPPVVHEELEEIARRRVALAGGRGAFAIDFPADGLYRLRLKDPGSAAAVERVVSAAAAARGLSVVPLAGAARVELGFAKAAYRPGDTARIKVRAPFPGTLVLTLEGERVHAAKVTRLEEREAEVELPIPPALDTGLAVTALVIGPQGGGAPAQLARGAAEVPCDLGALRLHVALAVVPGSRAGQPVRFRAVVTTEDGEPAAGASLLAALTDAAAAEVIPDALLDPTGFLGARPARGIRTADSFRSWPASEETGAAPGDANADPGATGPDLDWLGPLRTGPDGAVLDAIAAPASRRDAVLVALAARDGRHGAGTCRVRLEPAVEAAAAQPAAAAWKEPSASAETAPAAGSSAAIEPSVLADAYDHAVRGRRDSLEEAVLRALPLLVFAREARAIPDAIQDLLDFQAPAGWLARWPGAREPARLRAQVHAARFLIAARRAGHPVPGEGLDGLLAHLAREADRADRRLDAGEADGKTAESALDAAYARLVLGQGGHEAGAGLEAARAALVRPWREGAGGAEAEATPAAAAIALLAAGAGRDDALAAALLATLARSRAGQRWGTLEETSLALAGIGDFLRERPERAREGLAAVFAPSASGHAAEPRAGANALRVERRLLDTRLEPVPPEALTLGALVVIEIRIQAPPGADSPRGERTVRVLSPHPAGLAVEALAPARALRGDLVPIRAAVEPDQVAAVFALPAAGGSYRYLARAVARGAFAWPAGAVEDLEGPRTGSVIAIMPGARVSVR